MVGHRVKGSSMEGMVIIQASNGVLYCQVTDSKRSAQSLAVYDMHIINLLRVSGFIVHNYLYYRVLVQEMADDPNNT